MTTRRQILAGGTAAALAAPTILRAKTDPWVAQRAELAKSHDANVKRLQDWIAQPSIAAEQRNVEGGAPLLVTMLKDAGFQRAEVVPTRGMPGVFATLDAGAKRTVGIYFMYDVKQADPKEWSSPPWEGRLVDRAGMGQLLIGRGAVNQKGPEAIFLAALHAMKATGRKLPVNLVLVAEGEEEIGSPHFADVTQRPDIRAALAKTVGIYMPATWQAPNGQVPINLGAKGIIELELVASGKAWGRGPAGDIHSSLKAGVDSPAWRLVMALSTLVSKDGNTPAIDGIFDKVKPLSDRDKALLATQAAREDEAGQKAGLGVKVWIDDLPYRAMLERMASQPTVNIEGLVAGYTGPGGKTVLPGRAAAKIDMRLVPDMTADDTLAKLKAHLAKRGYGDIEVNMTGGYDPTTTPFESKLIAAMAATYKARGVEALYNPRLAGSWPGHLFTNPPLALAAGHFGLGRGTGAHAPDEYLVINSTNPKVSGFDDAALSQLEFLQALAAV